MADEPHPTPTPQPSPPSPKEMWTTVPASQALVEAPRSAPRRKSVRLSVVRVAQQARAPVRAAPRCALCGEGSRAPMGQMALGPIFVKVCQPCADAATGALRLFTKLFSGPPAAPGRRRK